MTPRLRIYIGNLGVVIILSYHCSYLYKRLVFLLCCVYIVWTNISYLMNKMGLRFHTFIAKLVPCHDSISLVRDPTLIWVFRISGARYVSSNKGIQWVFQIPCINVSRKIRSLLVSKECVSTDSSFGLLPSTAAPTEARFLFTVW